VPAIVSVLKSDGAGARAGLTTGDQILAVESHGKTTPVTYFPALADALRAAAAGPEASPTAQLKVVAAPVPAEKDDSPAHGGGAPAAPGPERTVTLALDPLKALPPTASNREVMAALGLADAELTVADVTDGAVGRLHPGDVVTAWNGTPLRDVFSLREVLIANTKSEADLTVLRDMAGPVKSSDSAETGGGKPHAPNLAVLTVKVPLKGIEAQRPDGTFTVYTPPILFWGQPAEPPPVIERYDNLVAALGFGLRQTGEQTRELVNNVVSLITGDIPLKALGGPMLIAKVAGDSARRGWQTFLGSLALISINLGILNLFPIPVLDGGQLVLMGAEAVRRRPLREAAVENFQKIGFAMILALVVLATYNDLSRFWKSMLESVVGLFQ
jgi:regulator of sigma E protease